MRWFVLCGLAFWAAAVPWGCSSRARNPDRPTTRSSVESAQREKIQRFWQVYRSASMHRSQGELSTAVEEYRQALALRPQHEDSLYYLGNCLFELKRYEEAKQAYEELITANPLGSSRGYVQLGLLYACLDHQAPRDLTQAEHYFRRALEVDPDSGALLGLGEVSLLRGRIAEAKDRLSDVNADNPMSVPAAYLLGYIDYVQGNRNQALEWYREVVRRCLAHRPSRKWSQEGDLRADPELRWRALARQSVFGEYWMSMRKWDDPQAVTASTMSADYDRLRQVIREYGTETGAPAPGDSSTGG